MNKEAAKFGLVTGKKVDEHRKTNVVRVQSSKVRAEDY